MLYMERMEAMKRIKEEFYELDKNPLANIGGTIGIPDLDNIFEWRCTLSGQMIHHIKEVFFSLK